METSVKSLLKYKIHIEFNKQVLLAVWAISIVYTVFYTERYEHFELFAGFGISFLAYLVLVRTVKPNQVNFLILGSILIRFLLIFAFPKLSDDIYRFIWDGRCWLNGIHPFQYTPEQLINKTNDFQRLNLDLYRKLNSPQYFTIYPAVCQIVFFICSWLAPKSIIMNAILIKMFLFCCEVITILVGIKILKKLQLSPSRILWYALNPLILIEICGNAHFEGAMIAFFALGFLSLYYGKKISGSIYLSFSVASKMLTALLFPLICFNEIKKGSLKLILYLLIFTLVLTIPLLSNFNIFKSLDLYFRKFEFNAGIYYLLRWVGLELTGYNQIYIIGPALSIITTIFIITFSYFRSEQTKWPQTMLWIFTFYLLFATTVHPWYLSMIVFLSIFNNYKFPVIWSALIFITYINYQQFVFNEKIGVVWLEYILIISIIFHESGIFKKIIEAWTKKN